MNVYFIASVTGKWLSENGNLVNFSKAKIFVNLVAASEAIDFISHHKKLDKKGFKVMQLVEVKI